MTIDKHVPLPAIRTYARKGGDLKYPFRDMVPGDSAFFPGENKRDKQHPAFMAARNYVKRLGWRMTLRTVTEDGVKGIRIWRVK